MHNIQKSDFMRIYTYACIMYIRMQVISRKEPFKLCNANINMRMQAVNSTSTSYVYHEFPLKRYRFVSSLSGLRCTMIICLEFTNSQLICESCKFNPGRRATNIRQNSLSLVLVLVET